MLTDRSFSEILSSRSDRSRDDVTPGRYSVIRGVAHEAHKVSLPPAPRFLSYAEVRAKLASE